MSAVNRNEEASKSYVSGRRLSGRNRSRGCFGQVIHPIVVAVMMAAAQTHHRSCVRLPTLQENFTGN